MNIGIVTTWFERGAAMVSRAYRDTLQQEHDVFIYARKGEKYGKGDPVWDTPDVTWGPTRFGSNLPRGIKWSHFKRWVQNKNIDLLIFNEEHNWAVIAFCKRELSCKIAAYIDYYTSETVPFFDLYDLLLCNTKRHHSVFDWHRNAAYIPWGTDPNLFKPSDGLDLKGNQVRFFHSAGMNPIRKGTEIALRAFTKVKGDCVFNLHIQKPISNFPILQEICESDNRIKIFNETVGAPGLYHLGDVYVYPSILEGIGLSLPEAMACGLPSIITDNGPMNEFVTNNSIGRRVPPTQYLGRSDGYYWAESHCDPNDFAKAMQELVTAKNLVDMKVATRKYAEENLCWDKNAATLSQVVKDCLASETSPSHYELEEKAIDYAASKLNIKRQFVANYAKKLGINNMFFRRFLFT